MPRGLRGEKAFDGHKRVAKEQRRIDGKRDGEDEGRGGSKATHRWQRIEKRPRKEREKRATKRDGRLAGGQEGVV